MDTATNSSGRFRVFGYPFEVRSSLPPDEAKTLLREQKLRWSDPKRGPRGWIVGSLLCLQWSALAERGGTVVLARIADDGFGSRVHGRAGFDLGSVGLIGVVTAIVIFSIFAFALSTENFTSILLFDMAVLLIPGAVLWLRLASPDDPEPLVRFIRHVLERPREHSTQVATSHLDRTSIQSAKLNIDGHNLPAPSEYDVAQAVLAMKAERFLIINFGSNNFMQTALEYDRFILEKCVGSDHELYRAEGDFGRDDVIAVMAAYLRGSQPSKQISWQKVRG